MLVKLLLIAILIILAIFLIFGDMSSFLNNKHDNMTDVNDFLDQNEDQNDNINKINENELQKNKEKLNNRLEKQDGTNNIMSRVWSPNNTLESMITIPCLENIENVNRLTCFAAPAWWYPNDKYNPNNFRSKYYRESINPIYDYLGNAQDIYWDFKSVNQ